MDSHHISNRSAYQIQNCHSLTSLIKHDLQSTLTSSKLSIIVVDFLVSRTKPTKWHKTKIAELMGIVERHPKGNIIRFGLLFMTLNLVKIKEMTSRYTPHPNLFKLFEEVNQFINWLMCKLDLGRALVPIRSTRECLCPRRVGKSRPGMGSHYQRQGQFCHAIS